MIQLENIDLFLGVITVLAGIVTSAGLYIYNSGKNKGQKDLTLTNLCKKFDALKDDFEAELKEAKQSHDKIEKKIDELETKQDERINTLCSTVSELVGKIDVLIKKVN